MWIVSYSILIPIFQRIVCCGEGREKFGHVFLADTGTSNGDITGQSRPVNTCDFKQSRPFRIITGSEDNTAAVYEGPPFKFKTTKAVWYIILYPINFVATSI